MRDGPFGAAISIDIDISTTADDEFESALAHAVALRFPGMVIQRNPAIPIGGGGYVRPDLVLVAPGTAKVFLVADAKRRKEIRRRDVERLAAYRAATGADKAAIYYPSGAHVPATVTATANRLGVDLQPAP